jgi:hypothetical protein
LRESLLPLFASQSAFQRELAAAFGVGGAEDLELIGEVIWSVWPSGNLACE